MSLSKYAKMPPVAISDRKWPAAAITKAPIWCAVDLRDGNQALPNPMSPKQKLQYFNLLCDLGFKEIEVGFPAASADDWNFVRKLIEEDLIPDDVTISVLTQARPHLLEKTIESLAGIRRALIHYYIATSELHMRFVFGLEPAQILETCVDSAKQLRAGADSNLSDSDIRLEFSPEEFTDSDQDFMIELCDAVVETWGPKPDEKVVLNLPHTVERRLPNEYADLIEEFIRRRNFKDNTLISVHVHNDMGMAVAATMLSLMAGADRVEGTLFGHGERTGNVDLITMAADLEYMGIDSGIDLTNLQNVSKTVAEITDISPHPRTPYVGELVFTAFSGSHQDAIRKGLSRKEELADHFDGWKVPYLHVNPEQLGREYERFIRINSQSGKGGVSHVLESEYHLPLPRWVQIDFAQHVQILADERATELEAEDVWNLFNQVYVQDRDPITLVNYWPRPSESDPSAIEGELHLDYRGQRLVLHADGNGPVAAFVHGMRKIDGLPGFVLADFDEMSMGKTADAQVACYVRVYPNPRDEGEGKIGVGFGNNIDQAAARAVLAAINGLLLDAK